MLLHFKEGDVVCVWDEAVNQHIYIHGVLCFLTDAL